MNRFKLFFALSFTVLTGLSLNAMDQASSTLLEEKRVIGERIDAIVQKARANHPTNQDLNWQRLLFSSHGAGTLLSMIVMPQEPKSPSSMQQREPIYVGQMKPEHCTVVIG